MVCVDVGHHQGGCSAGAEGTSGEEGRIDAGGRATEFSTVSEGVGDVPAFDVVPGLVGRVVVAADGRIGRSTMLEIAVHNPAERLGAAEEVVVGGRMADLFTLNCILLVRERKIRVFDQLNVISVIQRSSIGGVDSLSNYEGDVTK